jgi:hypothetical protein
MAALSSLSACPREGGGPTFTSPRLRGEVDLRAQRCKSGEGELPDRAMLQLPLARLASAMLATLSPHAGRGKREAEA